MGARTLMLFERGHTYIFRYSDGCEERAIEEIRSLVRDGKIELPAAECLVEQVKASSCHGSDIYFESHGTLNLSPGLVEKLAQKQ